MERAMQKDTMRDQADDGEIVIPLFAENVSVAKQRIVTGRVKVATVCREREEMVNELLTHERVEIKRTPVGKHVKQVPEIRKEGDTLIIPLVEEVLVVERRLLLKEEVRVRRVREAERYQERVNVRRQDVVVTREPSSNTTGR